MAGHTAYTGVLLALVALPGIKEKNARKSVEWYQLELSQMDKKVTGSFADVYKALHLSMRYDGAQNAEVIAIGLQAAENLINRTEQKLEKSEFLKLTKEE